MTRGIVGGECAWCLAGIHVDGFFFPGRAGASDAASRGDARITGDVPRARRVVASSRRGVVIKTRATVCGGARQDNFTFIEGLIV
jgi:hypothetical protein